MSTKSLLTGLLATTGLAAASANAAVISIPDYTLIPDGTDYGNSNNFASTEDQRTDVTAAAGGSIVEAARPIAFFVTTFSFGSSTSADIYLNFTASLGQDRLGVRVASNGMVSSYGDNSGTSNDFNLGAMAGKTVTIITKFDYNANYSVDYAQSNASNDTFATYWINPTSADSEGSGWTLLPDPPNAPSVANPNFTADFASPLWNSSSFYLIKQRIDNNNTPGTAGASAILNTTVLTGTDATFANALAAIPEPSSLALLGLGGLLVGRRRRGA